MFSTLNMTSVGKKHVRVGVQINMQGTVNLSLLFYSSCCPLNDHAKPLGLSNWLADNVNGKPIQSGNLHDLFCN